eukprot:g6670.t1
MMLLHLTPSLVVASAASTFAASTRSRNSALYPSSGIVETALRTTAKSDFGGHSKAFEAAATWNGNRLRAISAGNDRQEDHPRAPHLCCADYEHGREAYSLLQELLSPEAVQLVAHSEEDGACYFATASHQDAATIAENHEQFRLRSFAPFPSALKVAPGLLEHGHSNGPGRLRTRHGAMMRKDNVEGLSVELAPGTLPAHSRGAGGYIKGLLGDLLSESIDLHATNFFWSDPAMAEGEHLATPEGAALGEDWSKAAAVVHGLSEAASTSPGDICSWNSVRVLPAGDDLLLVSGLDHLLYTGRGAGGTSGEGEAAELHVACIMGFVSFLAGRLEVLRVASRHTHGPLNAAARANIQSATTTDTPLTDAGLDGTGQVIQVVDTGLDETSCFFVHDETGDQITHGYYFDELGANFIWISPSGDDDWSIFADADLSFFGEDDPYQSSGIFSGGVFSAFPDRRKVIQYINLVKSDDIAEPNDGSFTSEGGDQFPWLPADEFEFDDKAGHGTHTAGSAAGATLNIPAELVTCEAGKVVSCVGGCIDETADDDDLVSWLDQYADIDRHCPAFGCDDTDGAECLSDDVSETLTTNGGMAQGAKLAIFDVFYEDYGLLDHIGNGLWEPCEEAGCKLHSNSWGGDYGCYMTPMELMYDQFMYENPENLLIFAAGNSGQSRSCTIGSPATGKNSLAVGATMSGNTRFDAEDLLYWREGEADIDTVTYFSSSGPTLDGRIKPEVVAPGDMIYSAASDGKKESHSCRLWAYAGTSMSCPIVAGASAMVRQYFMDSAFYATDMVARGFCDDWAGCDAFPPSSATIKALLINSANLMGNGTEPDGSRGFGRVHLEAGMSLAGDGSLALFVADAANTTIPELTRQEYNFDVDADAGLDFRVTLSWIDPPSTSFTSKQLVHDLDLAVISPSGVRHTMWLSGKTDTVNVNERVIVDAEDVETGVWSVWVWAKRLTITDEQSYSLVVNGAISPATDVGAIERSSSTSSSDRIDSPADPGIGVMLLHLTPALVVASAASTFAASTSSINSAPYPSLGIVEAALRTTAKSDFGGHSKAFEAAATWNGDRLRAISSGNDRQEEHPRAPHLCCADYEHGREAYSLLQELLSPEAVQLVAHSEEDGACYFATASHQDAAAIAENHERFRLRSFAPFPSALKVAPGLLEHGHSNGPGRLRTRHGAMMRKDNVEGLSVELAPGTLPAHSWGAGGYIKGLLGDLLSESIDLHDTNFWSDPAMAEGEHLATPGGAALGEDWSKAAAVVHGLSEAASTSPGDICSWNSVRVLPAGDDLLLVSGLDHLLYSGRGAGGISDDGEAAELHVACFMGLVSFLAGRLEVLRVASRHTHGLLNAAARANIQSATTTDTPLTDAGLDGTGQVIQVVDTGLDETSCFFVHDETGDQITHGYYFDELGANFISPPISSDDDYYFDDDYTDDYADDYTDDYADDYTDDFIDDFTDDYFTDDYYNTDDWSSLGTASDYDSSGIFSGGDFSTFPDRRKVIQYINLVKSDDIADPNNGSFTSEGGDKFPWLPADEFEFDDKAGHGTHTAGSAAGATLNTPAELVTCEAGKVVSCVGGCIDETADDDDLVSSYAQYADIDRHCPAFGCDDTDGAECLSDDVSETLTKNGGMAQGAKLAIFDVFYEDYGLLDHIGNGLWEPCEEAGCKLHSNSWGGDYGCEITPLDLLYDEYMHENPENLLIFAAGNSGQSRSCTIGSPATAKNTLAVGATMSGNTRFDAEDLLYWREGEADIDTVTYFSSSGPTWDGRIKPEVVAPGDMVRQYFMDSAFYATDMKARGFCDDWAGCDAFPPSSATIKALLINSANLMGNGTEPDGSRGFGRVHLEAGMPLAGDGSLALFVADAANTTIPELTRQEYNFDVDADAGLDFRVTLSWIDPPSTSFTSKQLVHDLDLAVISPSGVRHTMWLSGKTDTVNVNERVIVDAEDVETGVWSVWVWAKRLTITDEQSYSLVVNGAISPATDVGAIERSSLTSSSGWGDSSSPADQSFGASAASAFAASTSSINSAPYPSLGVVETALRTTAKSDFGGHSKAFETAATWNGDRLRASSAGNDRQEDHPRAPHLCCADYEHGREAYSLLQELLLPEAVRLVAHSEEDGACYFATASHQDAAAIAENHEQLRLRSFAPFPSALKVAPGLLEHGHSNGPGRLRTRHGAMMRKDNVEGLSVELAPGTLPAHSWETHLYIKGLLRDLLSESIDLHATNFWSDPAMAEGEHLATPGGAALWEDWSKAATVVHGLSEAASTSPGDICSWNSVRVHHAGDDLLLVSGLDHLLYLGRGAGGTSEEGEAVELYVACFMGLVSFLAGRLEVLRVASRHSYVPLNAAARANIQSATTIDTPLTDAGLDGTGQVIQVVDTGLDETSCFFVHDETGDQITHGYYFDELSTDLTGSYFSYLYPSSYEVSGIFSGGDFSTFPDRRKVIQYINLIKSDGIAEPTDGSFKSEGGDQLPWLPVDDIEHDYKAGHGTHTAGTAAGATLNNPAELVTCEAGKVVSCVGGCIDETADDDDLVSSYAQYADIDRHCPAFGCDDTDGAECLSDDVGETLTKNGGMAQGAKLAILDFSTDEFPGSFTLADYIGNGMWEPCEEAGCKLHSNSWGGDYWCELTPLDLLYDGYMYENPENLLIFAAGNSGQYSWCTIGSPATAKNILAVGATMSGNTRFDAEDLLYWREGESDIDKVAYFSSSGPTLDGRIKPEVVAPGDMIYSAASDGEQQSHSCRLWAYAGTSMSCPAVAGASAMVRQYFMDNAFYATDIETRGFCRDWAGCEAFPPSSATIKALLINSANLMGNGTEPDGSRGFGRVHLEAGMPLAGDGSLALFVADAANTTIPELTRQEYNFDVDADAGLDFRVTLSWIDPPSTSFTSKQLVHDLDLAVISPSGVRHTMWLAGKTDTVNVNERVIVDAEDVETGVWSVWVWAKRLTITDEQSYSLVVNGAISPATDVGAIERSSSTSSSDRIDSPADPGIGGSSGTLAVTPTLWSVVVSLITHGYFFDELDANYIRISPSGDDDWLIIDDDEWSIDGGSISHLFFRPPPSFQGSFKAEISARSRQVKGHPVHQSDQADDIAEPNDGCSTSEFGDQLPWVPTDDYDDKAGHGTHTAGSAAGTTLNTPAELVTCKAGKVYADIDRHCPAFGCDDTDGAECLSDDVSETLTKNGGMAQGAKLATLDFSTDEFPEVYTLADHIGNAQWEPCEEAGCKLHSNSWGGDYWCEATTMDLLFDEYMHEVRQYFMDSAFYATDMKARGFCDKWAGCDAFTPSPATIKLTRQEYNVDVDADAGLDFRVTLSWIDPPYTSFTSKQLVHDLDLAVISPSGVRHTIWLSGKTDTVNVNERVLVDAEDVESGVWSVWVWAKRLTIADEQSYSLVVNGAISPATDVGAIERSSSTSSSGWGDSSSPADQSFGGSSGTLAVTPTLWSVVVSLRPRSGQRPRATSADTPKPSRRQRHGTEIDSEPAPQGTTGKKTIPGRPTCVCCADYEHGREAYSLLQELLSPEAVQLVAHSEEDGACYFATASRQDAAAIAENHEQFRLRSFAPFPSALKVAPGLLEHGHSNGPGRLRTRHGAMMRKDNVEGLSVELAPGTLPAHSWETELYIKDMIRDLLSASIDLHATNFWSDPAMAEGEHLATPEGAALGQDWSKAAAVVHGLSEAASTSPGDICSWNSVRVLPAGDDLLLVSGLDHLLYSGRGAGGTNDDGEAAELHVACFMGLVSFLTGRLEVLRVASRHTQGPLNAAARANIQSATTTDTPLTDAGLDGTGQVIQVIDTGLDETSCFFVHDETGDQITHGYYFDELGANFIPTSDDDWSFYGDDDYTDDWSIFGDDDWFDDDRSYFVNDDSTRSSYLWDLFSSYESSGIFSGGDFSAFPDRRKVIQYINLVKSDDIAEPADGSFTSEGGDQFPWLPADEFEFDDKAGHGTHTAGSAAGATLNTPAELVTCEAGKVVSCVGGCIDETADDDDLVSSNAQYADIDRHCPAFGCDDTDGAKCLSNDVSETLTKNGGMAQGAKLAIFDIFYEEYGLLDHIGNGLWEPCEEAGCKLHSNSWGSDYWCEITPLDVLYDEYMYENPEDLLIFAAGNSGQYSWCTMSSPATAKNTLAVGATMSGNTRFDVEDLLYQRPSESDIDTVTSFSSSGPTLDGRIKPEVVAPGDMIYSAASDGEKESHSCRLWAYAGTSMSCPIVAGASAMVRQNFMDNTFYATDMVARGFCDEWSGCDAFPPSSATVKALLINSANLMGEGTEPDGSRGFGRVHLEAGMPLAGNGSLALFVADAANTTIPELTRQEYNFDVDADAGLDFRVTLSWIDPPSTSFTSKQLVHDLDLAVISPSGVRHTMWLSGKTDTVNVNERVIVDADDVETGVWSVWVWAKRLTITDEQSYSLVVNGAISPATDVGAIARGIGASSGTLRVAPTLLLQQLEKLQDSVNNLVGVNSQQQAEIDDIRTSQSGETLMDVTDDAEGSEVVVTDSPPPPPRAPAASTVQIRAKQLIKQWHDPANSWRWYLSTTQPVAASMNLAQTKALLMKKAELISKNVGMLNKLASIDVRKFVPPGRSLRYGQVADRTPGDLHRRHRQDRVQRIPLQRQHSRIATLEKGLRSGLEMLRQNCVENRGLVWIPANSRMLTDYINIDLNWWGGRVYDEATDFVAMHELPPALDAFPEHGASQRGGSGGNSGHGDGSSGGGGGGGGGGSSRN